MFLQRLLSKKTQVSNAFDIPDTETVAADEPRLPLHVLADDARMGIDGGRVVVEAG